MATSTVRLVFLGENSSAVRAVGGLDRSMGGLARTAVRVGTVLAAGVVGGLTAATKSAVEFDRGMRNVNSLLRLSEREFQKLSKDVLRLSKETGQGPKTLAEGMYDLASSGFDAAESVKVLRVSAKAASAGLTDTKTAAKAVAAALNAYHLEADDARKVSDILFQTVNKGVLTFEELAQNMGDLVPAAAPLGVTLEEVGAAIATITLQGVPAAEAATRVKNTMLQLASPSKALSKLLKEQGFESGEAAIKAKGFVGVLELFDRATKGGVTATAALTPEIRALMGVVGLTGKNLTTYQSNLEAMSRAQDGAGATAAAFSEQGKSISFQWQRAKATLEAAAIPIGQVFFPALTAATDMLGVFAGWLTKIHEAPDLGAKLGVISGGFQNLAEDVRDAVDRLLFGYEQVIGGFGGAAGRQQMPGIADQLIAALETADWNRVGDAIMDGLTVAVGRSAALAQALAGQLNMAIGKVDWVAVGRKLGPGLAAAVAVAFTTLLDPAFWADNWDLAIGVAAAVFPAGRLGTLLGRVLLRPFARAGQVAGGALADAAETAVLAIADRLPALLGGLFLRAVALAGRALGGLLVAAGRVAGSLLGVFSAMWGRLGRFFQFTFKVLGITTALNAVADFGGAAVDWIGEKIPAAIDKLGDALDLVPDWVKRAFVVTPFLGFISGIQRIVDLVRWLLSQAGKVVSIGVKLNVPSVPGWLDPRNLFRASGGFVPMGAGAPGRDSVPAMLTPGEIVLNRSQQNVLGGPRFLADLFGFRGERGPGFAGGGIVGPRGSGKSPHRKGRARGYRRAGGAAKKALAALTTVNQRQENLDRAYGQLSREFDISREEFIVLDAAGNEQLDGAAVSQRLSEIGQLVDHRRQLVALIDREKDLLKDAVDALEDAIKALLDEIKTERDAAQRDADDARKLEADLRDVNREIELERRKTFPAGKKGDKQRRASQDRINQLEDRATALSGQASRKRGSQGKHLDKVRTLQGTVADFRQALGTVRSDLANVIPFDRRDVTLDIRELNAEADAIRGLRPRAPEPAAAPEEEAPGTEAVAPDPTVALEAEIRRLREELGKLRLGFKVESTQLGVLGSFQKGTLHVPTTGLAYVHAGERITPAGVPARATSETPVIVQISANDELLGELLDRAIDVRVVRQTSAIADRIGRVADRRSRSGRA
jgi:TP901 family phage tail tape measure protein